MQRVYGGWNVRIGAACGELCGIDQAKACGCHHNLCRAGSSGECRRLRSRPSWACIAGFATSVALFDQILATILSCLDSRNLTLEFLIIAASDSHSLKTLIFLQSLSNC